LAFADELCRNPPCVMKFILQAVARRFGYAVVSLRGARFGHDACLDMGRMTPAECVRTICDVGANVGQSALRFKRAFPKAAIWCFEPVETTFQELRCTTKSYPDITCHHCALGSTPGKQMLFHQPYSEWNTLVSGANNVDSTLGSELIEIATLDMLLGPQVHRIDILKTDTEGYDLEVLRGAARFLSERRIGFVYSEVGFDSDDLIHSNFFRIHEFLSGYGFTFIALYEQMRFGNRRQSGYANALFAQPEVLAESTPGK
jgi:FkbM family methyltransferase